MNVKSFFILLFPLFQFLNGFSLNAVPIDSVINFNATIDTNLTAFQFCRPGIGAFFYKQTTGNLASPFRSYDFWDERKQFFNDGINTFKIYEFSEDMNSILPSLNTFSEIKFINGSKKEQNFSIKHFQKIINNLSAGLDFRIAHSDGFYNKQVSNFRNFNIYTAYRTYDGVYNLFLNYQSNKIEAQENGGLFNDSIFEQTGAFDSKVAAVNFNDVKNQLRSKTFFIQQRYNFFKIIKKPEEQIKDSLSSVNLLSNVFYLQHDFKYNQRSALFTADSFYDSFFNYAYYDTTKTNDSLAVKNGLNEVALHLEKVNMLNGNAFFYIRGNHQYFNLYQVETSNYSEATDTVLQNISVKPGGGITWKNGFGVEFYLNRDFNDLKFDYYQAFAAIRLNHVILINNTGAPFNFSFSIEKEKRNPDFVYSYYNSNHFIWQNQFNPVDLQKLNITTEVKFNRQSVKGSVDLFSVKDLTYFDNEAFPRQFHSSTNVWRFNLNHSVKLGKFNLINNFKYQHADNKAVIRLPAFSSYSSFFYSDNFFKRALYAQFGLDIRYSTLFYADAYMPATRQFYLQDEKEIGNYAYVDVFANFRIKTFRFFLKLEHINAGFSARTYYTVLHYPMPGRTFKFGVVWDFMD